LRLLLLHRRLRPSLATGTAATATTTLGPTLAFRTRLLLLRGRRPRRSALVALRTLLRARRVLRALTAVAIAFPSALGLLRARVWAWRARTAWTALFFALPSRFLLELLDLSLHEAASLRFLAVTQWVMTAVRAALPTFGIRFLTGRTKDAFG
jgi:hypothetical protein